MAGSSGTHCIPPPIAPEHVVMKRFALSAVTAFALLVPSVVSAQGLQLVYRPELRGMVAVPRQPVEAPAPIVARTAGEEIARHRAMAQGFRGTRIAQAAVHCDRLIARAKEARKQF
jgi:hypothetical protein